MSYHADMAVSDPSEKVENCFAQTIDPPACIDGIG